jgi:probable rRNA maturation factor
MSAGAPIIIDIAQESSLWREVADIEGLVATAVGQAVATGGLAHADGAELSVVLTDDAGIRGLNASWRAKDKPTNVLSFPAAEPGRVGRSALLGDIVLAYETLEREAAEAGRPLPHHLTHLLVHGFLHLFGYDHDTKAKAEAMEALETAILEELGIGDPYADRPPMRAAS